MMKLIVGAVILTALVGTGAAHAQTRLDHDVQKMWDDTFHPQQRGTAQTDWERRRDAERYGYDRDRQREAYDREQRETYDRDRHREAERAEWCRYHPGSCGGPGYGNAYNR